MTHAINSSAKARDVPLEIPHLKGPLRSILQFHTLITQNKNRFLHTHRIHKKIVDENPKRRTG
jgi:hypothetical protein